MSYKNLKWSDHISPCEENPYDHVKLKTPIGIFVIECKSWKDSPAYDIVHNGITVGIEYSLDDAKIVVYEFLQNLSCELNEFLNQN